MKESTNLTTMHRGHLSAEKYVGQTLLIEESAELRHKEGGEDGLSRGLELRVAAMHGKAGGGMSPASSPSKKASCSGRYCSTILWRVSSLASGSSIHEAIVETSSTYSGQQGAPGQGCGMPAGTKWAGPRGEWVGLQRSRAESVLGQED